MVTDDLMTGGLVDPELGRGLGDDQLVAVAAGRQAGPAHSRVAPCVVALLDRVHLGKGVGFIFQHLVFLLVLVRYHCFAQNYLF